jgi:polar amino acid transport system substrate-binding protein
VAAQQSAAPSAATLRFVSTPWAPFTNAPGNARFALDLVETALKRIGVTAQTTIVEPATFTQSMLSPQFDGSAAAWKDAERERVLLYSQPYLENRLLLVGRRGADVSATTLAALKGKKVVVVGGYAYGEAVTSPTDSGPEFIRSRGEEDSLAQLLTGTADYTLMDELVIQYILRNHGEQAQNRLQIGTTPLVVRPLHLAIRKDRADAASIIARFNGELRRMVLDRTYHQLLRVDWIRADVDGDGRTELIYASDQVGTTPPRAGYDLFKTPQPTTKTAAADVGTTTGGRFYIGGNTYETWASVPDKYKVTGTDRPNPDQYTATIFRFTW